MSDGRGASNRVRRRLLVIVNLMAVPYVAIRFPRELRGYLRGCWKVARHG